MERERIDELYEIAALQEELEQCCDAIENSKIHTEMVELSVEIAKGGKKNKPVGRLCQLARRLAGLGRQITFMLS
jgi:hypothetical protein